MTANEWTIIAIFVATQLILGYGFVAAMKGDNKVLQAQMSDVKEELKKLTDVMVVQAGHAAQIANINDRLTLTGKRLDEQSVRLNKFVDAIALNANARALLQDQSD